MKEKPAKKIKDKNIIEKVRIYLKANPDAATTHKLRNRAK